MAKKIEPPIQCLPWFLAGDRIEFLFMGKRATGVLEYPHEDGRWVAVMDPDVALIVQN